MADDTQQQYPADPGGHFESDAHRRVLAHMEAPGNDAVTVEELALRIAADDGSPYLNEQDAVQTVADELVDEGHAERQEGGFIQTKEGHETLNGPNAEEPPPLEGEALAQAELNNAKLALQVVQNQQEGEGHDVDPSDVEEAEAAVQAAEDRLATLKEGE